MGLDSGDFLRLVMVPGAARNALLLGCREATASFQVVQSQGSVGMKSHSEGGASVKRR